MEFLEHDIQEKNFLCYIKRFLIAGIMEGTELIDSDRGMPQGGLISPVLANVYLHYVLDLWFKKAVKPKLYGYAFWNCKDGYLMDKSTGYNAKQLQANGIALVKMAESLKEVGVPL